MKTIFIGNTVTYKAAGKISRLNGDSGKILSGKVTGFDRIGEEDYVEIAPRMTKFGMMGSIVPLSKILSVKA